MFFLRLDINLASQPYEDARQFWVRWGTAVGILGVLTLALLVLDITGWFEARRDRSVISDYRQKIAQCDQVRARDEAILNLPENRTTRDQSRFLNDLIERKAFSWTRVLESLEKVMPPRVHVVGISPALNDDNQLALKLTVAGDSWDRAIELARRMEESRHFAQTNIIREARTESKSGDTEQFEIAAIYIPEQYSDHSDAPAASASRKTPAPPKPPTAMPKGSQR